MKRLGLKIGPDLLDDANVHVLLAGLEVVGEPNKFHSGREEEDHINRPVQVSQPDKGKGVAANRETSVDEGVASGVVTFPSDHLFF